MHTPRPYLALTLTNIGLVLLLCALSALGTISYLLGLSVELYREWHASRRPAHECEPANPPHPTRPD